VIPGSSRKSRALSPTLICRQNGQCPQTAESVSANSQSGNRGSNPIAVLLVAVVDRLAKSPDRRHCPRGAARGFDRGRHRLRNWPLGRADHRAGDGHGAEGSVASVRLWRGARSGLFGGSGASDWPDPSPCGPAIGEPDPRWVYIATALFLALCILAAIRAAVLVSADCVTTNYRASEIESPLTRATLVRPVCRWGY